MKNICLNVSVLVLVFYKKPFFQQLHFQILYDSEYLTGCVISNDIYGKIISKVQNLHTQMKSSSLICTFAKSNFGVLNFLAFKRWDVRLLPDAVSGPEKYRPPGTWSVGSEDKRPQKIEFSRLSRSRLSSHASVSSL